MSHVLAPSFVGWARRLCPRGYRISPPPTRGTTAWMQEVVQRREQLPRGRGRGGINFVGWARRLCPRGNILFLSACLVLAACGRGEEPAAPAGPPLRVGAYYWPGQYWVDIAHRKGWFAEAGLAIEWVDTNADYFGSFDQLADGSLDIVNMSQFDFLLFNARGKPLVGFLAADYTNGAEALVARPGIDSVRDLAGKRLALAMGTYLEYIWTIIAERHGLDPATVEIVDTPAETAPDALASGAADAFLTWEPMVTKALAGSGGVKLFDTSEVPASVGESSRPGRISWRGARRICTNSRRCGNARRNSSRSGPRRPWPLSPK